MRTLALMILFSIGGCMTPPPAPPPGLPESFQVSHAPDAVWGRVLDHLFREGLTVATSDRAGGVLTTEWMEIPDAAKANRYMTCPQAMGRQIVAHAENGGWIRTQVSIREGVGGGSTLRIQPVFQIWWGVTGPEDPRGMSGIDCTTTGAFEMALVEAIR